MARHNETGKLGEFLAKEWFTKNNYAIIETNWRFGKWEIDIIAQVIKLIKKNDKDFNQA